MKSYLKREMSTPSPSDSRARSQVVAIVHNHADILKIDYRLESRDFQPCHSE